ncbi:hypothetical protein [Paraclostridium bifermentans]|uniref:hypothetical protein n=1 Tax=Paraclostridium bifermentans TaxID=1490 RepID=UPI00374FB282
MDLNWIFLRAIYNELERSKGDYFTVCVNNEIVIADGKVARVNVPKYDEARDKGIDGAKGSEGLDPKLASIVVGGIIRENNKSKLVPNNAIHVEIINRLGMQTFGGIDFSTIYDIDTNFISIEKDNKLRILYITTKPYREALIRLQSESKTVEFVKRDESTLKLGALDLLNFKRKFTAYLVKSYIVTCENYLTLRLNKVHALSFYNCSKEFIPLMIMSAGLYNPFISTSAISNEFLSKDLAKYMADLDSVSHGDLVVYYLTTKEICTFLKIPKFVSMPWGMAINLIAGQLMPTEFPNRNRVIHLKIENGVPVEISEEELREIETRNNRIRNSSDFYEEKDLTQVGSYNSLNLLCTRYYRAVGARNDNELFNIISTVSL